MNDQYAWSIEVRDNEERLKNSHGLEAANSTRYKCNVVSYIRFWNIKRKKPAREIAQQLRVLIVKPNELNFQNLHGRGKEMISQSCSLTSICIGEDPHAKQRKTTGITSKARTYSVFVLHWMYVNLLIWAIKFWLFKDVNSRAGEMVEEFKSIGCSSRTQVQFPSPTWEFITVTPGPVYPTPLQKKHQCTWM